MLNALLPVVAAVLLVPNALSQNTSAVPTCILNCSTNALSAGGCTSITDFSCICTSVAFQTAAGACIAANCPNLATQAVQLQNASCAAVTGSVSGSGTATPSGYASAPTGQGTTSPPPTTSPSSSSTATTSSSHSAGFHTAGIASGVTLALFGAAFSLF